MSLHNRIPFEVGQNVESRSFENGFRGSWFRSKISSISKKKIGWGFHLEYLDFPDEKNTWIKAYQNPLGRDKTSKRTNREKKELMVRPPFPPVFRESQIPDVNTISEPVVIVNNAWKVGDLIDWWKDDCYWSGSITEITEDDKFQILLLPPPFGEGLPYEACSKDLRPTLQWSTRNGWTVPTSKDSENDCCARIINPFKQGEVPIQGAGDGKAIAEDTVRTSQASSTSWTTSQQPEHRSETQEQSTTSSALQAIKENQTADMDHDHTEKASCPDHSSSSHSKYDTAVEAMESPSSEKQASVSNGGHGGSSGSRKAGLAAHAVGETPVEKDRLDHCAPSKKKKKKSRDIDEKISLNSTFDDSIEASVFDLEELLARVKWMKGLLKSDNASTSKPPWKFIENRASSKR